MLPTDDEVHALYDSTRPYVPKSPKKKWRKINEQALGLEFPQNDKSPKLFGTNVFLSEFSILFPVFRFFWQAVKSA